MCDLCKAQGRAILEAMPEPERTLVEGALTKLASDDSYSEGRDQGIDVAERRYRAIIKPLQELAKRVGGGNSPSAEDAANQFAAEVAKLPSTLT